MHPFRALYSRAHDFQMRVEPPEKTYFLAAIPRVGSTYFAVSLWRTGVLGAPLEYLNLRDRGDDVDEYGGGDLTTYWNAVQRRRTSPNGVFGSKLFTNDFWEVFNRDESALKIITADRVVQLRRRNQMQQAISYSRAKLTSVWVPGGKKDDAGSATYNFDHLCDSVRSIRRQEQSWDQIIQRTEATSITIFYEDFDTDIATAVTQVVDFLGAVQAGCEVGGLPKMSRQRDELSAEWANRFNDDLAQRRMTFSEI